jgi:hypothetical protein
MSDDPPPLPPGRRPRAIDLGDNDNPPPAPAPTLPLPQAETVTVPSEDAAPAAPSEATLRLRRNEKLKARADILNKAAGAFLVASVITPVAGAALNPGATKATWGVYVALAAAGVAAALILHGLADKLLNKLEA